MDKIYYDHVDMVSSVSDIKKNELTKYGQLKQYNKKSRSKKPHG